MKCALYVRVSTDEQDMANQAMVLREWAEARGFEIVEVFQEEESAWRDGHQRELSRLFRCAHQGRFRIVLVWALDRLTRGGPLAILSMVHRLGKYGVKVLSHQESWTEADDVLQPLLLSIAGWVASMESRRISERTKAGLARVRAEGKHLGRPRGSRDKKRRKGRGPWRYTSEDKGTYHVY